MANKRSILVLGGTGPTGIATIREVLNAGHKVTVYARSPQKLPTEISENLAVTVVVGELNSTSILFPLLRTTNTIISLLGPTSLSHTGTPISEFYSLLLAELNVLPSPPYLLALCTISSSSPMDRFAFSAWLLVSIVWLFARGGYTEFVTMAQVFMTQGKATPWVLFRVGGLGGKVTGHPKAGYIGDKGYNFRTPQADIGAWVVQESADKAWVGKFPAIWAESK